MNWSKHDLLKLSYQKVVSEGTGVVSMDGHMMRLLMELHDGESVIEAAKRAGITTANQLRETLGKLLQAHLIQPLHIATADDKLGEEFARILHHHLAAAVGPMADFLLPKALSEMGATGKVAEMAKNKAAGLVMHLARQIPREEKRLEFQKALLAKIPK